MSVLVGIVEGSARFSEEMEVAEVWEVDNWWWVGVPRQEVQTPPSEASAAPHCVGLGCRMGGLGFEGDLDSMMTDLGQVRKLLEPVFAYPFERYHCPS